MQLELFSDSYGTRMRALRPHPREVWPPPLPLRTAPSGSIERAIGRLTPHESVQVRYDLGRGRIVAIEPDPDTGARILRAQSVFRSAPNAIAEAIVRLYLTRLPRGERHRLAHDIQEWHADHAPPPPLDEASWTPGHFHPLRPLYEDINDAWFEGALDLEVGFSPRRTKRLMGRHERRAPKNLILLNPLLDHPEVARWYVAFVVFHECLHEAVPPRRDGTKLMLHPPEFRRIERAHPDWPQVRAYEQWLVEEFWPRSRAAVSPGTPATRERPA